MSRAVVISSIAILTLGACKQGAQKVDLDEVMTLKTEVDNCLARVDSIDFDRFMEIQQAVKAEQGWMNENNTDTLSQEEAIFLSSYFRSLRKPMARILKGHDNMLKALKVTSKQLGDLHQDMEKGLVEPEQYKEEFKTEKMHAQQQLKLGNEMADEFKEVVERYEQDHERVVEYVNTHRNPTE